MSYDEQLLRRAAARLAKGRREQEERREALCRQVYARLPRVEEIDTQLRRTAAQAALAAFQAGDDPAPAIRALREENLALQRERAALLSPLGYAPDALDERPLCGACGDTGWLGSEMCDCLRRLYAQEQMAALSQLLHLGEQSFERFELDWYSSESWPGEGQSPRRNMEFIREACLHYAQKFGKYYFDNLLLTGKPGLGKTFLSACIARVVSESGFSVVYDTAGNVFSRFETEKFTKDEEEARLARVEVRRFLNCDLLILDDLGSELTTPFVQTALYQVVNTRLAERRRTIISTNLTADEIRQRYTPQLSSRLEGEYQMLRFFGEDIRRLRKQRL